MILDQFFVQVKLRSQAKSRVSIGVVLSATSKPMFWMLPALMNALETPEAPGSVTLMIWSRVFSL